MTTAQPAKSSRPSSKARSVFTSISLVGSSSNNNFEGSYSEYEENKLKRLGNEEPKRVRYRKLMTD